MYHYYLAANLYVLGDFVRWYICLMVYDYGLFGQEYISWCGFYKGRCFMIVMMFGDWEDFKWRWCYDGDYDVWWSLMKFDEGYI